MGTFVFFFGYAGFITFFVSLSIYLEKSFEDIGQRATDLNELIKKKNFVETRLLLVDTAKFHVKSTR